MKDFNIFKIENLKIVHIRAVLYKVSIIIGLVSSMIFSFYFATEVLIHYYMGFVCFELSIVFFLGTTICASAFNKILKDK